MDLCVDCEADLLPNGIACPRCAEPLPVPGLCPRCLKRSPPQDSAHAVFRYHFPLDSLITGFKFNGRLAEGRLLAQLFAQELEQADLPEVDRIIPVPLHARRLRERGFNQSLVLLERIRARRISPDAATRIRATAIQSSLDPAHRRRNLKGAFQVNADISGERVALVDDVMTTGNTLMELARVCKRAGAAEVHLWVLARAAAHHDD